MEPIVISRNLNIVKAGGGFSHTILLGKDNKLYSMGSNKRAQCGMNIFNHSEVKAPEELYCFFTKDEKILDIKCGFHHTVVLTDKKAYFFGSNEHNQFPFPQCNC
jgi:alpha-tubulin suppressor-like RCC1 family protein